MFEKFENGEKLYFAAGAGDEGRVKELLAWLLALIINIMVAGPHSTLQGHPHIIRLLHQAGAELESRTDAG